MVKDVGAGVNSDVVLAIWVGGRARYSSGFSFHLQKLVCALTHAFFGRSCWHGLKMGGNG